MILAVDTSLPEQVLCLAAHREVRHASCSAGPRGGLAARIAALLQEAQRSPRDLKAIAVVVGPGSFTGLRAGVSAAVGMAMGLQCPLIPIPALEVAAARVPDRQPVLVLRAAGRGEIFAALYDAALQPLAGAPWCGSLLDLPESWWHAPSVVVLEAPDTERVQLQAALPARAPVLEEKTLRPRAAALAARAAARLDLRETVGYDEIRLLYGQRPSTTVPRS